MGFSWRDLAEGVGDVAEVAGKVTGNPILSKGGQLIGAIVDDDIDTSEFIEDLSLSQLINLQEAITKQMKKKL